MKDTIRLKIIAPNRIHISLLAMDELSYRKNGGVGFAIDFRNLHVEFERSHSFKIFDSGRSSNCERCKSLLAVLENAKDKLSFKYSLAIHIIFAPEAHLGLGSGTSLFLACLEALFLLNNKTPIAAELIDLSGRGGTSGIGINTYFNGGFIFDLGRKNDFISHAPSSFATKNFKKPLTVLSANMPEWSFGVCIVKDAPSITSENEIKFFNSTCPLSKKDVEETLYHVLLGTVGGVLDADRSAFSESINAIQKTKWKSSEIDLYGDCHRTMMQRLKSECECVGMSSLGPILYFIANDVEKVIEIFKEEKSVIIKKINVNNVGREISYV